MQIVFSGMVQILELARSLTKLIHPFTLQNTQHLYKVTESKLNSVHLYIRSAICVHVHLQFCAYRLSFMFCKEWMAMCSQAMYRLVILTFSMEQSPSWEANQFSAFYGTQSYSRAFTKPATCPYPEPDQSSPCPPSHFLKILFIVILPSTPGSAKWSFFLRFPCQNPLYTSSLPHMCYMPHPSHLSQFDHQIIFVEKYRSLSSSLCSFLHYLVTSSLLGPNILLNNLFSNTRRLRSASMWATKFHTDTQWQTKL